MDVLCWKLPLSVWWIDMGSMFGWTLLAALLLMMTQSCKIQTVSEMLKPNNIGRPCPDNKYECPNAFFRANPVHCLDSEQICDGLIDCDDTSDELYCSNCTNVAFRCKEARQYQVRVLPCSKFYNESCQQLEKFIEHFSVCREEFGATEFLTVQSLMVQMKKIVRMETRKFSDHEIIQDLKRFILSRSFEYFSWSLSGLKCLLVYWIVWKFKFYQL